MKITQGYLSTIISGNFSAIDARIFIKIVSYAQRYISHKIITKAENPTVTSDIRVSMSIKDILRNSHCYDDIKKSAINLAKKQFEYVDQEANCWRYSSFIYNIELKEKSGIITFSIPAWLLNLILDYSKGFSRYDMEKSLQLSSSYAIRLYMLTCSASRPFTFKIDFLRKWLGCTDKYPNTSDFIKRVITASEQELQKHGFNGFHAEINKAGKSIDSILFMPVKRGVQISEKEAEAKVSASVLVPPLLTSTLVQMCQFSYREISANKGTLYQFSKLPDYDTKLLSIIERFRKKRASKGYIIRAMQSEIHNTYK